MKHSDKAYNLKLRELRISLGLSQSEVASYLGVSDNTVSKYERGIQTKLTTENFYHHARRKLRNYPKVFHEDVLPVPVENFDDLQKKILHSFTLGKCYKIYAKQANGHGWKIDNSPFVFLYVGKNGIHHTFKEFHAGWSRTYTDAQLVDKVIQEVLP